MEKRDFNDFYNYREAYEKFKCLLLEGKSISEIAYCYDISVERVNNILVRFDEVMDPLIYKAIMEHYNQFSINDDKVIIISDTHVGNTYEYLKLFDSIFNYCCKLDIKNIIHAGDIVDGNSFLQNRKYDIDIQISNLIDIFSQDGIPKMFYLYGNHDYNMEIYDNISLKDKLIELKELVYIGKGNSYVHLNDNDPINIYHELSSNETYIPKIDTNLRLEGHHHSYHILDNNVIHLPALSLISGSSNLGFVTLHTTGNEFILDVHNGLNNNRINYLEQKIIKKHM